MWFAGEISFVAAVSDRRSALRERRHKKTFDPFGVERNLGGGSGPWVAPTATDIVPLRGTWCGIVILPYPQLLCRAPLGTELWLSVDVNSNLQSPPESRSSALTASGW